MNSKPCWINQTIEKCLAVLSNHSILNIGSGSQTRANVHLPTGPKPQNPHPSRRRSSFGTTVKLLEWTHQTWSPNQTSLERPEMSSFPVSEREFLLIVAQGLNLSKVVIILVFIFLNPPSKCTWKPTVLTVIVRISLPQEEGSFAFWVRLWICLHYHQTRH